eukprot:11142223-Alexandrium_andersonii.AAC.1
MAAPLVAALEVLHDQVQLRSVHLDDLRRLERSGGVFDGRPLRDPPDLLGADVELLACGVAQGAGDVWALPARRPELQHLQHVRA